MDTCTLIMSSSEVPPLLWVVFVVLLILSAFFSASETAYTSMSSIRLTNYAENGKKSAIRALKVYENYDNTLSTILIGNNIVNIGMATIGAFIAGCLIIDDTVSGIVSTAVVTILVLIFGEILPKSMAKRYSESIAMKFSYIISFLNILFIPLNFLFKGLRKIVTPKHDETPSVTEDELETIVENMADEGVLEGNESELIKKALKLSDKLVEDIMVPRIDMVAVKNDETIERIKEVFFDYQYSRIPVYKDDKDKIVGILYERDLFTALIEKGKVNIEDIMKPAMYVSKKMPVDDLIHLLQKKKIHIAIVSGKYGETAGLVTMEDALEELVGEIYDEHDVEKKLQFEKISDDEYLIDADVDVEELFEKLKLGKAPADAHNRLASWLYELIDEVPRAGSQVEYIADYMAKDEDDDYIELKKKLIFTVKEVIGRRIAKVFIKIENIEEED